VTFHVSNNEGLSSSILPLAQHADIWPQVHFTHNIEMRTDTLDNVLRQQGFFPDAMIVDTQGSELLVLKGAQSTLPTVNYVLVEAADFEAYQGCAKLEDIEKHLKAYGMTIASISNFAKHPNGGGYYNALFSKSSVV
jgi:hypothetical protein